MEYQEFSAKTLEDAITEACEKLALTSDLLEYDVVSEGSGGFLGMGARPWVIRARRRTEKPAAAPVKEETSAVSVPEKEKTSVAETPSPAGEEKETLTEADAGEMEERAKKFLADVFRAMQMQAEAKTAFDAENHVLSVELEGEEMGVLIGKRGQTLDSLQYLTSLIVNKGGSEYVHVKVDTENYRERRKATLENLAKNIARKVRNTRRPVSLEPMNPYERRIIHSALQNDRYVTTHSEGEEPYRKVVVTLKR